MAAGRAGGPPGIQCPPRTDAIDASPASIAGREADAMTAPQIVSTPESRRPLRLKLGRAPGQDRLDGAWWPYSRDLESEVSDLVQQFPPADGQISGAVYSRPDWDTAPRELVAGQRVIEVGASPRDDSSPAGRRAQRWQTTDPARGAAGLHAGPGRGGTAGRQHSGKPAHSRRAPPRGHRPARRRPRRPVVAGRGRCRGPAGPLGSAQTRSSVVPGVRRPVRLALLEELVTSLLRLVGHVGQAGGLAGEELLADQAVVEQVERVLQHPLGGRATCR